MQSIICALSLLTAAPTLAGHGPEGEAPQSIQSHYLQRQLDAEQRVAEAKEAEKQSNLGLARDAYAKAFVAFRQAAMLSMRCNERPIPAPVTRLLFQRAADASKSYRALLKALGENEASIEKQTKELNRHADEETQAILEKFKRP